MISRETDGPRCRPLRKMRAPTLQGGDAGRLRRGRRVVEAWCGRGGRSLQRPALLWAQSWARTPHARALGRSLAARSTIATWRMEQVPTANFASDEQAVFHRIDGE